MLKKINEVKKKIQMIESTVTRFLPESQFRRVFNLSKMALDLLKEIEKEYKEAVNA